MINKTNCCFELNVIVYVVNYNNYLNVIVLTTYQSIKLNVKFFFTSICLAKLFKDNKPCMMYEEKKDTD